MSDHGFGPVHSFFLTNNWLASLGLLKFKRNPWTAFKRLLFRLGYTPLTDVPHHQGTGPGQTAASRSASSSKAGLVNRVFLSFDDVDWSRTKAFSIGSFGQVYINLAGTRPEGIVQPGQEYEELDEEIAREAPGPARSAHRRTAGRARLPPRRDLSAGPMPPARRTSSSSPGAGSTWPLATPTLAPTSWWSRSPGSRATTGWTGS